MCGCGCGFKVGGEVWCSIFVGLWVRAAADDGGQKNMGRFRWLCGAVSRVQAEMTDLSYSFNFVKFFC